MKRILSVCVMAIMVLTLQAQEYLGIQLGYARPITQLNDPGIDAGKTLTPSAYNGFKVGVVYDATIIKWKISSFK